MKNSLLVGAALAAVLSSLGCGDSSGTGGAGGQGGGATSTTSASTTTSSSKSSSAATTGSTTSSTSGSTTSASSSSSSSTSASSSSSSVASSSATGSNANIVFVSCAGLTPAKTITTSGFAFSPTTETLNVGEVLKFTPTGFHDMTADNGDFATPTNQEACLMFMTAGTWPFHCSVHPFMTGTLTVQ